MGVRCHGVQAALRKLGVIERDLASESPVFAMRAGAAVVRRRAQENIKSDLKTKTGDMAKFVRVRTVWTGGLLPKVCVESTTFYTKFQELGTQAWNKGDVRRSTDYRGRTHTKHLSRGHRALKARHMFLRAVEEGFAEVQSAAAKTYERRIRRYGPSTSGGLERQAYFTGK